MKVEKSTSSPSRLETQVRETLQSLEGFRKGLMEQLRQNSNQISEMQNVLIDIRRLIKKEAPIGGDLGARVQAFIHLLVEAGAEGRWVKLTYGDIRQKLNIKNDPTVSKLIKDALDTGSVRKFSSKAGTSFRGNWFTLNQELPLPDDSKPESKNSDPLLANSDPVNPEPQKPEKTEKPASNVIALRKPETKPEKKPSSEPADITAIEDAVLEKLFEVRGRMQMPSFSINLKNLSRSVGFEAGQVSDAMRVLEEEGAIRITQFDQRTWEYFLHIPEGI